MGGGAGVGLGGQVHYLPRLLAAESDTTMMQVLHGPPPLLNQVQP